MSDAQVGCPLLDEVLDCLVDASGDGGRGDGLALAAAAWSGRRAADCSWIVDSVWCRIVCSTGMALLEVGSARMASWRAWEHWICWIDELWDARVAAESHSERCGLGGGLMSVDGPDDVVFWQVVAETPVYPCELES